MNSWSAAQTMLTVGKNYIYVNAKLTIAVLTTCLAHTWQIVKTGLAYTHHDGCQPVSSWYRICAVP